MRTARQEQQFRQGLLAVLSHNQSGGSILLPFPRETSMNKSSIAILAALCAACLLTGCEDSPDVEAPIVNVTVTNPVTSAPITISVDADNGAIVNVGEGNSVIVNQPPIPDL